MAGNKKRDLLSEGGGVRSKGTLPFNHLNSVGADEKKLQRKAEFIPVTENLAFLHRPDFKTLTKEIVWNQDTKKIKDMFKSPHSEKEYQKFWSYLPNQLIDQDESKVGSTYKHEMNRKTRLKIIRT